MTTQLNGADCGLLGLPPRADPPKRYGSFLQPNRFVASCDGCSLPIYLQTLCCFRISCSSSLHKGYDEPEILRYENLISVPTVLTSDSLTTRSAKIYLPIGENVPDSVFCRLAPDQITLTSVNPMFQFRAFLPQVTCP